MQSNEVRDRFLEFFEGKGHAVVPSSSLVPENDPTTLFTGSGMQPMIQYLLGEKHPKGVRIVDSQKCFRSQDIDEVGDNRHTTFFEMLGNWSLGDYFKDEQLLWFFEFLTKEIGLDPARLYVTVFRGSEEIEIPKDEGSVEIWKKVFQGAGVEAEDVDFSERDGMQGGRIFYYDDGKNWWSRSGVPALMPVGEPGGPDSEVFWDFGEGLGLHEKSSFKDGLCHVNCDCGRFLEIGNSVFMEYVKTESGFDKLAARNVDFGGGLERIVAARNDTPDVFLIDAFRPLIGAIERISGKKYGEDDNFTAFRVIADHLKAATFIMSDPKAIVPSNTDQGYVVRRLVRRAVRYGRQLGVSGGSWASGIAGEVVDFYKGVYPELEENRKFVSSELEREEEKFMRTLDIGVRKVERLVERAGGSIVADEDLAKRVFDLYQTDGFPLELTLEEFDRLGVRDLDRDELRRLFGDYLGDHQELSRSVSAGKFKGGLADGSEETTKLHTATHLVGEALRRVLGSEVKQRGSNITRERLRYDFSFDRKLTDGEIGKVESLVNEKIGEGIPVTREEMSLDDAESRGAQSEFGARYLDKVTVYSIGDFSREICGGPHVSNTLEIGGFKISKQEAVGAGVRRIRAVIE